MYAMSPVWVYGFTGSESEIRQPNQTKAGSIGSDLTQ